MVGYFFIFFFCNIFIRSFKKQKCNWFLIRFDYVFTILGLYRVYSLIKIQLEFEKGSFRRINRYFGEKIRIRWPLIFDFYRHHINIIFFPTRMRVSFRIFFRNRSMFCFFFWWNFRSKNNDIFGKSLIIPPALSKITCL